MEEESEHVTIQQAIALLHRSDKTIRRMIQSGKLPARKIGLQWLIARADIDDLQSGGPVPTLSPDALLPRLEALEHELASLRERLDTLSAPVPRTTRPNPTSLPTSTTEPKTSMPESAPAGAIHLAQFAAEHGVNRRTLLDQVKRFGLAHIAIAKPNRPREMGRYFTQEQQTRVLELWNQLGTPHH